MPRGRPRKLRNENETEENTNVLVKDIGAPEDQENEFKYHGFDVTDFKPYVPKEPLPDAEVKFNKKTGSVSVIKRGEPRYYFNENMKELIAVYKARSKKTELVWLCKYNHKNEKLRADHRRFRDALIKRGIPVRGRDF